MKPLIVVNHDYSERQFPQFKQALLMWKKNVSEGRESEKERDINTVNTDRT